MATSLVRRVGMNRTAGRKDATRQRGGIHHEGTRSVDGAARYSSSAQGSRMFTGDRPSTVTRITDGGVTSQGPVRPRLHTKYAGTPVATIPRPIKACTGRATIVFPTIAAAAAMNSAGVTG